MATVLFIDIRNFTRYARTRGPEEIALYQNAFFKIVIDVVMRYNGVVHQFLGDGCMVTFGTPIDVDNPSRNAVFAALALLKELQLAHEEGRLAETKVGIGIHTGEIVKGAIGPSDRQQDFISGTVVILASRIEQMNKQFGTQILVSEEVIKRAGPAFATANCLNSIMLKGWHQPVTIYQIA